MHDIRLQYQRHHRRDMHHLPSAARHTGANRGGRRTAQRPRSLAWSMRGSPGPAFPLGTPERHRVNVTCLGGEGYETGAPFDTILLTVIDADGDVGQIGGYYDPNGVGGGVGAQIVFPAGSSSTAAQVAAAAATALTTAAHAYGIAISCTDSTIHFLGAFSGVRFGVADTKATPVLITGGFQPAILAPHWVGPRCSWYPIQHDYGSDALE